MDLQLNAQAYREAVLDLPFGKRLPTAIYVHWDGFLSMPLLLQKVLGQLRSEYDPSADCNLVKFFVREMKLSLLSYPEFESDAHPCLVRSVTIHLATGKIRDISYLNRNNPPILHRKETFLPPGDPRIENFARLTRGEESFGLLEETSRIGFKLNWEQLLSARGIEIVGHQVREVGAPNPPATASAIPRHLTAIPRSEFSKPVKALLQHRLLTKRLTFFDYGCGLGDDLRGLESLGYNVAGWDPHFSPATERTKADVVNLGFVLNVIEDSAERVEVIQRAWSQVKHVLCVTVLADGQAHYRDAKIFEDGVLTQRRTFQKHFEQSELLGLIEHCLDVEPIPLGLGMCLAFRRLEDEHDFLSQRTKRAIDWESLNRRLRALRPSNMKLSVYERNPELLDNFWQTLLSLGRCPRPGEYERSDEIRSLCKSLGAAVDLFVQKHGLEELDAAAKRRKEDLLVYLSAGEFQKRRPGFARLSKNLRTDIKAFFGDYKSACAMARELLFASGDTDEIELATEDLDFGWSDQEEAHFAFHRTCIELLPPILRIYIECAARLYGDPQQADIIKVHIRSGKLSFLHYENFEADPFPQLLLRIKVDLRHMFVNVYDHALESPHQILFFKERFLPADAPKRNYMEQISRRLRNFGVTESMLGPNDRYAPDKQAFESALHAAGLNRALAKHAR